MTSVRAAVIFAVLRTMSILKLSRITKGNNSNSIGP